ncbi:hypothetical protein [Algoriphagus persicinus]|uniref:hypothetical protein n=1 Tax=Algoriphagus persicinus TaxID=3108754 RepID=UPI002B3ABC57|nr:hypothetical protein [Algoriphagus sp. E1-3-M2]MEB2784319.1 hypothetical protein [Algoriphagus sp. E1-3-M2]
MSTVELKSHITKLVEDIQNEKLLESLFEFLSRRKDDTSVDMWSDLTADQKQELLDAYEASENKENLVAKDKLFRYLK